MDPWPGSYVPPSILASGDITKPCMVGNLKSMSTLANIFSSHPKIKKMVHGSKCSKQCGCGESEPGT